MRVSTAVLAALVIGSPVAGAKDFPRLGIFRKKTPDAPATPPAPAKGFVETLQKDTDEAKRKKAAEELGTHDPRTNADILPTLVAAIQKDPSPTVRSAAAESIGKIKPVTQSAGVALEQTSAGDPSEDVRKAAAGALWQYHLNGYRSSRPNPAFAQTGEPPLAKPKSSPATTAAKAAPQPLPVRPITTGIGKGAIYAQTVEPPMAKPKPTITVTPPAPAVAVPPLPTPEGRPPVPSFSPPGVPAGPSVPPGTVPAIGFVPPSPTPTIPGPGK